MDSCLKILEKNTATSQNADSTEHQFSDS